MTCLLAWLHALPRTQHNLNYTECEAVAINSHQRDLNDDVTHGTTPSLLVSQCRSSGLCFNITESDIHMLASLFHASGPWSNGGWTVQEWGYNRAPQRAKNWSERKIGSNLGRIPPWSASAGLKPSRLSEDSISRTGQDLHDCFSRDTKDAKRAQSYLPSYCNYKICRFAFHRFAFFFPVLNYFFLCWADHERFTTIYIFDVRLERCRRSPLSHVHSLHWCQTDSNLSKQSPSPIRDVKKTCHKQWD